MRFGNWQVHSGLRSKKKWATDHRKEEKKRIEKKRKRKKLTQSSRVRLSFAVSQIEAVITSVKKKNLEAMQYAQYYYVMQWKKVLNVTTYRRSSRFIQPEYD